MSAHDGSMWDGPRRTYTCAYQGSSTAGPLVKHTHKTPLSCRPATSSIPRGPSPLPSRGYSDCFVLIRILSSFLGFSKLSIYP